MVTVSEGCIYAGCPNDHISLIPPPIMTNYEFHPGFSKTPWANLTCPPLFWSQGSQDTFANPWGDKLLARSHTWPAMASSSVERSDRSDRRPPHVQIRICQSGRSNWDACISTCIYLKKLIYVHKCKSRCIYICISRCISTYLLREGQNF